MNFYKAIKDRKCYLKDSKIKTFAYQLLKAMEHMHKNDIFHRDIKPENILIKDNYLVLADLGSCKGIYSKPPFTEYVSTRWYRAPECIMTNGYYNYKMDMWGVGCVLFEISTLFPLFPGDNEIDQMKKIENILGTPNQDIINIYKKHSIIEYDNRINYFSNKKGSGFSKYMSHCSNELIDLISNLLIYNIDDRFSAKQALQHNYFKDINDQNLNMLKMSIMGINNSQLMKNFINESLSFIKSTEDSQGNINNVPKKKSKEKNIISYLPEVNKKNSNNNNNGYIYNEQHSQRSFHSSNNEEDANNSNNKDHSPIHKSKLPKLGKIRFNNQDKGNNINNNNNHNNNNLKVVSMLKKMNILKQKYISPYSQKAIFNIPQRHNN